MSCLLFLLHYDGRFKDQDPVSHFLKSWAEKILFGQLLRPSLPLCRQEIFTDLCRQGVQQCLARSEWGQVTGWSTFFSFRDFTVYSHTLKILQLLPAYFNKAIIAIKGILAIFLVFPVHVKSYIYIKL